MEHQQKGKKRSHSFLPTGNNNILFKIEDINTSEVGFSFLFCFWLYGGGSTENDEDMIMIIIPSGCSCKEQEQQSTWKKMNFFCALLRHKVLPAFANATIIIISGSKRQRHTFMFRLPPSVLDIICRYMHIFHTYIYDITSYITNPYLMQAIENPVGVTAWRYT